MESSSFCAKICIFSACMLQLQHKFVWRKYNFLMYIKLYNLHLLLSIFYLKFNTVYSIQYTNFQFCCIVICLSVEPRLFFLLDDLSIKLILAISWRIIQVTSSTCGWLFRTTHVQRLSQQPIVIWLLAKHTVNRLDSPGWNLHIFVQPLSSLI